MIPIYYDHLQHHSKLKKIFGWIEIIPYLIKSKFHKLEKFVVVTGADKSHYKSLQQFLSSLHVHETNITVIVFDLGLVPIQLSSIKDKHPFVEVRHFDYKKYPSYFNINLNAGEYAWKPIIFHDILHEYKCCVCWMDSGNLILDKLYWLQQIAHQNGMYSPYSWRKIKDLTHKKTLEYMKVSPALLEKRNLNGACVVMCYKNILARKIASQWKKCALTKECIAPQGSNRKNHRQDQSVLSIVAHQSGITARMPSLYYGFKIHQDID